MNNFYEVHSWSKLYREEALQEAQRRHLAHQAKAHRRQRPEEQMRWSSWLSKLAAAVEPS